MTVFGLHLGGKISVPECPRGHEKGLFAFAYGMEGDIVPPSFICFRRSDTDTTKPNAPVDTNQVGILVPDKDTPLGVMFHVVAVDHDRRAAIVAQIVGGNIEAVTIYLWAFSSRTRCLQCLRGNMASLRVLKKSANITPTVRSFFTLSSVVAVHEFECYV